MLTGIAGLVGVVFSLVVHVLSQLGMLVFRPDWSLASFRSYYQGDQLSYLTIVVNGSLGLPTSLEPFTLTGPNDYPHLWYSVLGAAARWFDLAPTTAWNLGGILLQAGLVVTVSLVSWRITGRWWAAYAGAVPLLLGTFSWAISGNWMTGLDSHATLWGTFAMLFTLNGEAAAFSISASALLVLLATASRPPGRRGWVLVGVLVAATIGVLANVQTYAFLSAVYLVCYVLAVHTLVVRPRRALVVGTVALLPVLYVVGPVVEATLGQLPALLFGLLPAVPGLVVLVLRTRGLVLVPAVVLAAAASPQVVGTALALAEGDPFLSYRVASSKDLGVPWGLGLLCASAVLLPLAATCWAGVRRRRPVWVAVPIALVTVWVVLASNDLWGANQEPYRFWIEIFGFGAVVAVPLGLDVARTVWSDPAVERGSWRPTVSRVLVGCVVAVMVLSAQDWRLFFADNSDLPLTSFTSPENDAIARAASQVDGDGLLLAGPCILPGYLKPITGRPIAFYNLGMAWPREESALRKVGSEVADGVLPDDDLLRQADVGWLVTRNFCDPDWRTEYRDRLELVTRARFDPGDGSRDGVVTLWRVAQRTPLE